MEITLNNKSLEEQQNISFHIKNLPNELINYIFGYVSLVPFDKKELMTYITNYKADYAVYFNNLMAFHKNALYREDIQYDGCRTRIKEDIWNYEFYTKHEPKTKNEIYNTYIMKSTFMDDVNNCKLFNKSQCYRIIRKEISKDIIKKIVLENNLSNRSISRLKLDELRTILFTYLYRYN